MKLALVVLTDQIPNLAGKSFNSAQWDLSFEAGLVTMTAKDAFRGEETYLVPLARVIAMRPEKAPLARVIAMRPEKAASTK